VETELAPALKDAVLRRMAGEQSYNRGHEYFKHGDVVSVETAAEGIHAAARPADYTVSISSDDGVVIIPVIARAAKRRAKTKRLTLADAAQLLQDEDKDALVRMLLDWAQEDPVLQRLLQHAARRSSPEAAAFVHALEALREKYKIKRNFLKLLEELTEDAESGVNLQTAGSSVKKLVTLTTSPSRSMCRYSSRRPKWPQYHCCPKQDRVVAVRVENTGVIVRNQVF